jgi:hypothetical protein
VETTTFLDRVEIVVDWKGCRSSGSVGVHAVERKRFRSVRSRRGSFVIGPSRVRVVDAPARNSISVWYPRGMAAASESVDSTRVVIGDVRLVDEGNVSRDR